MIWLHLPNTVSSHITYLLRGIKNTHYGSFFIDKVCLKAAEPLLELYVVDLADHCEVKLIFDLAKTTFRADCTFL